MHMQVRTDRNIEGHDELTTHVTAAIAAALDRFSARVTRIEVHLSDQNGGKTGPDDKRCVMEARVEGRQPTAVTHEATSLDQAVAGATAKLARLLDSTLGRFA